MESQFGFPWCSARLWKAPRDDSQSWRLKRSARALGAVKLCYRKKIGLRENFQDSPHRKNRKSLVSGVDFPLNQFIEQWNFFLGSAHISDIRRLGQLLEVYHPISGWSTGELWQRQGGHEELRKQATDRQIQQPGLLKIGMQQSRQITWWFNGDLMADLMVI